MVLRYPVPTKRMVLRYLVLTKRTVRAAGSAVDRDPLRRPLARYRERRYCPTRVLRAARYCRADLAYAATGAKPRRFALSVT
eukprot:2915401-Rhodomonas_salina.3